MRSNSIQLKKITYLFIAVLPITIGVGILKFFFHYFDWEPIGTGLFPFLSSAFAGTFFILGFMLAGVLSDFKESEKFPSDILGCLYVIQQEAEILLKKGLTQAADMQSKLCMFIDVFKHDFLVAKNDRIFDLLDSFSDDFLLLDEKGVPPPLMARLRNEQANLNKIMVRIKIIRTTTFAPGVYAVIEAMILFLTIALLLLKFEFFGILEMSFVCLFFFLLFSVFTLLKDLDDPFEYQEGKTRINEISFDVLFSFGEELRKKIAHRSH
jgi:hypothetical protein